MNSRGLNPQEKLWRKAVFQTESRSFCQALGDAISTRSQFQAEQFDFRRSARISSFLPYVISITSDRDRRHTTRNCPRGLK